MSTILPETNSKGSSLRPTKHIRVKYFYIKDTIDKGEITVEHCPMDQMWTDINTKPKQGSVFHEFRGQIMCIPSNYNDDECKAPCHTRPADQPTPIRLMVPLPRTEHLLPANILGFFGGKKHQDFVSDKTLHA
jgi:hypothetical protein